MAVIETRSSKATDRDGFFDPSEDVLQRRHHLPHWHQNLAYVFLTWRLANSLPHSQLLAWGQERAGWLAGHPRPWSKQVAQEYRARFGQRIDQWLDAGLGACVLRQPPVAALVVSALTHFDGERYSLDSFVVMPNHVHVLFRLAAVVHT